MKVNEDLMRARIVSTWLAVLCIVAGLIAAASAQEAGTDDVQQGHRWAIVICSLCHVVAPDQEIEPVLRPPAPSFESIVRRSTTSIESVRTFLQTTHRDLRTGEGMPKPQLMDFQIRQVAAYLLSLRK
jgi:mono/diheme cytochrome c family protein